MDERLEMQMRFLLEADKMKGVLRATLLTDKSRRENDAEHSWHLALMAMLLFEHAGDGVDLFRVLKMALVHDLVEIYAGDTPALSDAGQDDQEQREREAADKLFALLPPEQGAELRGLWEEFDAMETPDARYAAAIDRMQPFLHNTATDGHTWVLYGADKARVYRRMDMVRQATPTLWPFVEREVEKAMELGWIKP